MDPNEGTTLRSINNDHPSWVTFINTTRHDIEIFWINYEGQAVSYGKLHKRGTLNMRTYATHPWIFVDASTMERYLSSGQDVFYPKASKVDAIGRPQLRPRYVFITIPMYTLREIAMRMIKSLLNDDNDAYQLDIPHILQRELANMEPKKNPSS